MELKEVKKWNNKAFDYGIWLLETVDKQWAKHIATQKTAKKKKKKIAPKIAKKWDAARKKAEKAYTKQVEAYSEKVQAKYGKFNDKV